MTFNVVEHVPDFSALTDAPESLQIFFDDAAITMLIFDDEGTVIPAFLERHDFEMVLPFLTVQLVMDEADEVGVVVGTTMSEQLRDPVEVVVVPLGHTLSAVAPRFSTKYPSLARRHDAAPVSGW